MVRLSSESSGKSSVRWATTLGLKLRIKNKSSTSRTTPCSLFMHKCDGNSPSQVPLTWLLSGQCHQEKLAPGQCPAAWWGARHGTALEHCAVPCPPSELVSGCSLTAESLSCSCDVSLNVQATPLRLPCLSQHLHSTQGTSVTDCSQALPALLTLNSKASHCPTWLKCIREMPHFPPNTQN